MILVLGVVIGYSYDPVTKIVEYKYQQYLNHKYQPKFKVGDCIKTWGSLTLKFLS